MAALRPVGRTLLSMMAVIPVRHGVFPVGAAETIAECDGHALIVGSATSNVALNGVARHVHLLELGDVEIGRWAQEVAAIVAERGDIDAVVLPHSPDGRDLAPRLAFQLGWPLFAGASRVTPALVQVVRDGGRQLHDQRTSGKFVATLQPGVRNADGFPDSPIATILDTAAPSDAASSKAVVDAVVVEVLPPDVRTMDLTESRRIVGGGAGLDSAERFEQLDTFATAIDASMGATRVITDRGWIHHDKQIGTTGVVIDPVLYLSFGVSGAVQHTAGLGSPDHIISVNTDPHCPMMSMSDLAIVSDANATLDELLLLLDAEARPDGIRHG